MTELLPMLCLLGLIFGSFSMLFSLWRRRGEDNEFTLFKRALSATRNPREKQDKQLEELAERVAELKDMEEDGNSTKK